MHEAFAAQKEYLLRYAAERKVEYSFISPKAPQFGGLWEAAVKQAKYLLLREVGNTVLSQEEMVTMLAEVGAVLNSRPIAPLTPDPNDGEALTSAHLLIDVGLRSLPHELEVGENVKGMTSLKRWRLISALKRTSWRAWSKDYILVSKAKPSGKPPNPA